MASGTCRIPIFNFEVQRFPSDRIEQSKEIGLNPEMNHYRHLTSRDRAKISRMKSYGWSYSKIAKRIGVNKSTISREVRRNGKVTNRDLAFQRKLFYDIGLGECFEQLIRKDTEEFLSYVSAEAELRAKAKKKTAAMRNKISEETKRWVIKKLEDGWTPDQIAGRSKQETEHPISHESVYRLILLDKKAGGKLYRLLPRFGKRKSRFPARDYTSQSMIPGRVSIEDRPSIVSSRKRLGDLEGDLIVGSSQKSYLVTVVDRVSRQVAIEKILKRDKESVTVALIKSISRFPRALTLTLDNAREFSCHIDVTRLTGVKVYFSNPYASYERGTVENTNGLIRRSFPKRTDFRKVSVEQIQKLELRMNATPRKILKYLTATEVANKSSRKSGKAVALRS